MTRPGRTSGAARLAQKLARGGVGTFVIFALVTGYFWATQPGYLDPTNLMSLARQYSELGIVAVGMTMVIATGGIDISVGGTVGMTSMLLGVLALKVGLPFPVAALLAMCAAGAVGALNGWAIAYLRLEPMLVTLATMSLTRGVAYILTSGASVAGFPAWFANLSGADIKLPGLSIPLAVLLMVATFIIAAVVLRRTSYGRTLFALGQSEPAAALSGVNVRRTKFSTYFLLGILGGVAGLMLCSRTTTAFADAGKNYEFEAITAVVFGGTSLSGGEGSLLGTLVGVATMAMLRNGLSLAGQSDLVRTQMLALALVAAVLLDNLRRRLVSRSSRSAD